MDNNNISELFDYQPEERQKLQRDLRDAIEDYDIEALDKLIEDGAPFYENKEYNDLVTVAPLVDCLDIQVKDKYYQDKFNLLWKYASDSQKKYLIENYNLNNSLLDSKLVEQKIIEGDLSSPLINELDFDGIDISGIKFEKPHK